MINANSALEIVLDKIRNEGPKSEFSKQAFVRVLDLLPAAPNIPGLDVFCAWAVKGVPYFVDFCIIREGKVFLTYRSDQHYRGWHFPGFFRLPEMPLLENCQEAASREFGDQFRILGVEPIFTFDQEDDTNRFHHATNLMLTQYSGEPQNGEWFSEMPENILRLHRRYWPHIEKFLKA